MNLLPFNGVHINLKALEQSKFYVEEALGEIGWMYLGAHVSRLLSHGESLLWNMDGDGPRISCLPGGTLSSSFTC